MRPIIEARIEGDDVDPTVVPIPLAVIDRRDDDLEQLGLSLAEGRELLGAVQSVMVSSQASIWVATQDYCHHCHTPLRRKDTRPVVMRTVFGNVSVDSPRFWTCDCDRTPNRETRTIGPLSQALPERVTPELAYLQTKWAAHLPHEAATRLLKGVLPLQKSFSASGTRHRMRTADKAIAQGIEEELARLNLFGRAEEPRESEQVTVVSVGSAWLKHCEPARGYDRQVNVAAGRATLVDGNTKLYAYVGKGVRSPAARQDRFLTQNGVRWDERVTVIGDGAGEFTTAGDASQLERGRILDRFHIAMKFRAAEQSWVSSRRQDPIGPGSSAKSEARSGWFGTARDARPCRVCRRSVPNWKSGPARNFLRFGGTCVMPVDTSGDTPNIWSATARHIARDCRSAVASQSLPSIRW